MEDIAPGLLDAIRKSFAENIENSKRIADLHAMIESGTAAYADAEEYARLVGEALSQAFGKHLSSSTLPDGKLYYNIADRVVRPLMEENHSIIAEAAEMVQASLNKNAGIGLAVQHTELNTNRIDELVNKVSNADTFDDVASFLGSPVVNFLQNVVDATLWANVDFQGRAGRHPRIIRKSEWGCCKWCSALAGEYEYPDVPPDVYRRHQNCNCIVEYDPGDGPRQNVHTKQFTQSQDYVKMEARKIVGIRTNGVTIQEVGSHVYDQMAARNVTMDSILDALISPLDIKPVKYDDKGRPSFTVVGRKATATVNPDTGKITTTYPTHTKTANKLLRKKGMK